MLLRLHVEPSSWEPPAARCGLRRSGTAAAIALIDRDRRAARRVTRTGRVRLRAG